VDFHPPGAASQAAAWYRTATAPFVPRPHDQVAAFFDGFDLVEPGLVQAPLWRPDGKPPRPRELEKIGIYAGVARKSSLGSKRHCAPAASVSCYRRACQLPVVCMVLTWAKPEQFTAGNLSNDCSGDLRCCPPMMAVAPVPSRDWESKHG
jgi:hypothetical protein